MVPPIEYSASLIMESREISMTVHFKNNLCHWFPNLLCVSAYRWVSRLTVDGFIISAPRQRGLHSVRPSVVAGQHFLVLLPCCPEIILKEVCQPTEVAQWEWREYEPMRDFINITSDPPRTSRAGPAVGGIWTSCLPLYVAGWEGRGSGCRFNGLRSARTDDVTGSQSKVSPGGSRKKANSINWALLEFNRVFKP